MAVGEFFLGSPERFGQQSKYSPENQNQFNQFISQLLSQYLQGGQDFSQGFEPIAAQAREGFQSKTLPSIMERLTSMGGGGGRSSASFNVPAQAAVDLELGLGAERAKYGQGQQQLLQNLLGLGQQDPFYMPRQSGFLENFTNAGLQAGGAALGGYLGGPAFAMKKLGGMAQGGQG